MKRICKIFFAMTLLLCGVVGLASCGKGHPHEVEEKWARDSASHWHPCTECDEQVDFGLHTLEDWVQTEGKCEETSSCSVCGFKKTRTVAHKYGEDNLCSVCGDKKVVIASGTPTKAAEPMAVYAKVPKGWTKANCWYWTDPKAGDQSLDGEIEFSEQAQMWPGLAMTLVDATNNIYGFKIPAYTNMIIFNNGTEQTVDIALVNTNYYVLTETGVTGGKYNITDYSTYEDNSGLTLNQYPSTDVKVEYVNMDIYVQAPADWTKPLICFWDTTEGTWPEYAELVVVDATNHIYKYTMPNIVNSIILSGGEGKETKVLTIDKDNNLFVVTDKDNVSYSKYTANAS